MLSSDATRAWQVTVEDWARHRRYHEYLAAVKDMLTNTDTPHSPWTVVPATNMNYRLFKVYGVIIKTLEQALGMELTLWPAPDVMEAEEQAAQASKKARKQAAKARKAAAQAAAAADEAE
jgi:hypothetical protein